MRRTVVTILTGLAILCAAAVVDVVVLGGDGKVRRGIVRDCLTILEDPTPCGDPDAWYRITKEEPTSDGCSKGRRRSEDGDRCLEPIDEIKVPKIDVDLTP